MNNQRNTQQVSMWSEIPGVIWDENVRQWLVIQKCEGQPDLKHYYRLVNDAIAALRGFQ